MGRGNATICIKRDHIHFKGKLPFIVLALLTPSQLPAFAGFLPSLNVTELSVPYVLYTGRSKGIPEIWKIIQLCFKDAALDIYMYQELQL